MAAYSRTGRIVKFNPVNWWGSIRLPSGQLIEFHATRVTGYQSGAPLLWKEATARFNEDHRLISVLVKC